MPALPDVSSLGIFVVAALVLLVTPGPAVLYIVARSLDRGRRAGLVSVLGVHTGTLVHVGATAAGLSALLAASGTAFSVVKYLGAAYLIYLGLRRLLDRAVTIAPPAGAEDRLRRAFLDGVVVRDDGGSDPRCSRSLAEMSVDLEAARLFTYHATWLSDTEGPTRATLSAFYRAKYVVGEAVTRITRTAMTLGSAHALFKTSPLERLFRDGAVAPVQFPLRDFCLASLGMLELELDPRDVLPPLKTTRQNAGPIIR